MATFAVMSGDYVSNVIVADTKEVAEEVTNATCIEYDETNPAGIGYQYDGEKFNLPVFVEAVSEETLEDPA